MDKYNKMNELQLATMPELMQELSNRCQDGCMIVCCYKDEDIPIGDSEKDYVMTAATGFYKNEHILHIIRKLFENMTSGN